MLAQLHRSRRWIPDDRPSGFFTLNSGAFARTSDGQVWNTGFGALWVGENAQIWMNPSLLASHHPLVAELHQEQPGLHKCTPTHAMNIKAYMQLKQRDHAFQIPQAQSIFQIKI